MLEEMPKLSACSGPGCSGYASSHVFVLDSTCYNCEVRQKRIVPVIFKNVMIENGK